MWDMFGMFTSLSTSSGSTDSAANNASDPSLAPHIATRPPPICTQHISQCDPGATPPRTPRVRGSSACHEDVEALLMRNCHFGPALEDEYLVIDTPQSTRERRNTTVSRTISGDSDDIDFDLSAVDRYPWCPACFDRLLPEIDARCTQMERDCRQYGEWVAKAEHRHAVDEPSADQMRADEQQAQKDADALEVVLRELAAEQTALDGEIERLQQTHAVQTTSLDAAAARCEALRNEQLDADEQARFAEQALATTRTHLQRLCAGDPLRDAFHIELGDTWGTINGMRLGIDVERELNGGWLQVNSGLGQMAQLLEAVCVRMGYRTVDYRLVPMAGRTVVRVNPSGHTYMKQLPDALMQLPLYAFEFGHDGGFDRALMALLTCVGELTAEVQRRQGGFALPNVLERTGLREGATQIFFAIR